MKYTKTLRSKRLKKDTPYRANKKGDMAVLIGDHIDLKQWC